MKKSAMRVLILSILILLTLLFIFSRSLASPKQSAEESRGVGVIVRAILGPIFGEERITDHFVRKLAHFTEFALLGAELSLLFFKLSPHPVFFSLLAALTDETIQIFSGRGPAIADVWLDFAGACFGILAGLCVVWLTKRRARGAADQLGGSLHE